MRSQAPLRQPPSSVPPTPGVCLPPASALGPLQRGSLPARLLRPACICQSAWFRGKGCRVYPSSPTRPQQWAALHDARPAVVLRLPPRPTPRACAWSAIVTRQHPRSYMVRVACARPRGGVISEHMSITAARSLKGDWGEIAGGSRCASSLGLRLCVVRAATTLLAEGQQAARRGRSRCGTNKRRGGKAMCGAARVRTQRCLGGYGCSLSGHCRHRRRGVTGGRPRGQPGKDPMRRSRWRATRGRRASV